MKTVTGEEGKKETETIRYLVDQRLKARVSAAALPDPLDAHLDEDSICAFVEGRLEESESAPVTSHLIACAACRHTTAQLIRLESQFDSEIESAESDAPSGVRALLDRLASHVTPSFEEDAVFAYQSPESEADQNGEAATQETPPESADRD